MDGKALSDLRVAELRNELEKRNKEKFGVKQVLLDRLRDAIEAEGYDPDTYRFGGQNKIQSESPDINSLNGEDHFHEKVTTPVVAPESVDSSSSQNHETSKRICEDTVTYVVQVGDQEDLDYDLKTEISNNEKNIKTDETNPENESIQNDKDDASSNVGCNLRVSNLPKSVKAADLKQKFSKGGKVVSATIALSTRAPDSVFGFLQMATSEDALNAIKEFNNSDFGGFKITVELTEKFLPKIPIKNSISQAGDSKAPGNINIVKKMEERFAQRQRIRGRLFHRPVIFKALRRARARQLAGTKFASYSSVTRKPYSSNRTISALSALRQLRSAARKYHYMKRLQTARPLAREPASSRLGRPSTTGREQAIGPRRRLAVPAWRYSDRYQQRAPTSDYLRKRSLMFENSIRSSSSRVNDFDRFERQIRTAPRYSGGGPYAESSPSYRRLSQPSSTPRPSYSIERSRSRIEYESPYRGNNERSFSRVAENPERPRFERRYEDRSPIMRERVMDERVNRSFPTSQSDHERRVDTRYDQISRPSNPMRNLNREYRERKSGDDFRRPYPSEEAIPRSRPGPPLHRSYEEQQQPRFEGRPGRSPRDRSPPYSSGSRPKLIDYEHRSGSRSSSGWSSWKNQDHQNSSAPSHSWKPIGHSFTTYGNRDPRRY